MTQNKILKLMGTCSVSVYGSFKTELEFGIYLPRITTAKERILTTICSGVGEYQNQLKKDNVFHNFVV